MKIREYKGPFTVLTAGAIGFSLFCIVSAAALADPGAPNVSAFEPQELVDSAVSNLSTVAALTVEVIAEYVATFTPRPTDTFSILPTSNLAGTPTLINPFLSNQATRTRAPRDIFTPSRTPTRIPSRTSTPIPPFTQTPEPTDTDVPPTNTPIPTDTDTPIPDTDTPVPPTDTPTDPPPPTETPEDTPTPPEIQITPIP